MESYSIPLIARKYNSIFISSLYKNVNFCTCFLFFPDEDTTQLTIIRNINELNGNCIAILQDRRANLRLSEEFETEEENAEGTCVEKFQQCKF